MKLRMCLLLAWSSLVVPACGTVPAETVADAGIDADPSVRDAGEPADAAIDADPADPDAAPPADLPTFGVPQPVLRVHRSTFKHRTPRLVAGGQALYFVADTANDDQGGALFVARRATGADFANPVAVPGTWTGFRVLAASVADDELEVFVDASRSGGPRTLYRSTRDSRELGFREPVALAAPVGALMVHIADDELFFSRDSGTGLRLFRATRGARGAAFSDGEPVTVDGQHRDLRNPWLSADRRTLYYNVASDARTTFVYRAVRDQVGSAVFAGEELLTALNVDGANTSAVSLGPDEIYFESNRSWSPAAPLSIWRARACRGIECAPSRVTGCSGSNQRTSLDGRHCYTLNSSSVNWETARQACVATGGRLVSVHSAAEGAVVWDLTHREVWMGASDIASECNSKTCSFVWEGGEPFLYRPWTGAEPDDGDGTQDCGTFGFADQPGFADGGCAGLLPYVCESEVGL